MGDNEGKREGDITELGYRDRAVRIIVRLAYRNSHMHQSTTSDSQAMYLLITLYIQYMGGQALVLDLSGINWI